MKAKTIVVLGCACPTCRTGSGGCARFPDGKIPIGTIMESPDAWKYVEHGVADPADEECQDAITMTPHQLQQRQHAYKRTDAGIHPEDYSAFDAGEMVGYYPDGSWKPGPNATHSEGGLILDDYDYD